MSMDSDFAESSKRGVGEKRYAPATIAPQPGSYDVLGFIVTLSSITVFPVIVLWEKGASYDELALFA
ncbi:hypothetical protein O5623_07195 [Escherichia coli]|nr:hypothetical protein [Escherichia coli]